MNCRTDGPCGLLFLFWSHYCHRLRQQHHHGPITMPPGGTPRAMTTDRRRKTCALNSPRGLIPAKPSLNQARLHLVRFHCRNRHLPLLPQQAPIVDQSNSETIRRRPLLTKRRQTALSSAKIRTSRRHVQIVHWTGG